MSADDGERRERGTSGFVAAGVGSLAGLVMMATLVAIDQAEGEWQRFVTYVTGDPHGLLELDVVAISISLSAGVIGAPLGVALALWLAGHDRIGPTAVLTLLLTGLGVFGLVIAAQGHSKARWAFQ